MSSFTEEDFEWMRNRMEQIEQKSKHWPRWMQQAAGIGEFAAKKRKFENKNKQKPKLYLIKGNK